MVTRKSLLVLAAATCAGLSMTGRAATITFSYDPNDMKVSFDGGATFSPATFNPVTNTVYAFPGAVIEFGVDVLVTNNPNPAATGTTGAATYNSTHQNQPTTLGLAAYGFGLTDSKHSVANVVDLEGPGSAGTTTSERGSGDASWDVFLSGNVDDAGGGIFTSGPESAGVLAAIHRSNGSASANTGFLGTGGGTAAELLNSLEIQVNTYGTAVFTPSDQVAAGNVGLIQYFSGGSSTASNSFPTYTNVTVYAGDGNTVNNLPALTVAAVEQIPEPASAVTLSIGAVGLMMSRRQRQT